MTRSRGERITAAKLHRDKGHATEAGHVILDDARDRFDGDLIHAVTHPDNKANASVLHNLGFHLVEDRLSTGRSQRLWEIPRIR